MNMKSILSFHCVSDDLKDVDVVLEFAQKNDVHLDMVILVPLVRPVVSTDAMMLNDTTFESNRLLTEEARKQKKRILERGDQQGLSMSMIVETADAMQFGGILASYANCADCLVLERSILTHDSVIGRSFVKILMDASCPTLLLSGDVPKFSEMTKVLACWDGGVAAATALRHAVPFLRLTKEVTLITVDPTPEKEGENPGDDMALYLTRHDIDVNVESIPSAGKSVAHVLMQKAEDLDTDLTVMGGYGRSRLREWILGGTTKETLSKAKRSVFMAHG